MLKLVDWTKYLIRVRKNDVRLSYIVSCSNFVNHQISNVTFVNSTEYSPNLKHILNLSLARRDKLIFSVEPTLVLSAAAAAAGLIVAAAAQPLFPTRNFVQIAWVTCLSCLVNNFGSEIKNFNKDYHAYT